MNLLWVVLLQFPAKSAAKSNMMQFICLCTMLGYITKWRYAFPFIQLCQLLQEQLDLVCYGGDGSLLACVHNSQILGCLAHLSILFACDWALVRSSLKSKLQVTHPGSLSSPPWDEG